MKGSKAIVGVFTYVDDTINAVQDVRGKGHDFKVYAPTFVPELDEAISPERSPMAIISLIGAVTGLVSGFTLAILCALDWPLRVSAKDIVAIPSFVVIGYECTILFGAIFTLMGIFHFCRLPDIFRRPGYDPRFSCDKFGVVVGCENDDVDSVTAALKGAGADEVEVRDGL